MLLFLVVVVGVTCSSFDLGWLLGIMLLRRYQDSWKSRVVSVHRPNRPCGRFRSQEVC